jgi:hypothetical protein
LAIEPLQARARGQELIAFRLVHSDEHALLLDIDANGELTFQGLTALKTRERNKIKKRAEGQRFRR